MELQQTKFSSAEQAVTELTSGAVDVFFIKKSTGQPRHMHCTLDEKYIPQGNKNTLNSIIAKSLQSGAESYPIVVWDLLISDWRVFICILSLYILFLLLMIPETWWKKWWKNQKV